jgi:tRNA dimethylallyltransferase
MNKIIIVTGPTASGKTSFAVKLAKELDGEIINADSLQVYSENPIISAQPTSLEKQDVPHHLFGYVKGDEEYTIARWINDAVNTICKMKKTPILVGGTGFYLKHLIFGLSPIPEIPTELHQELIDLHQEIGTEKLYQLLKELDPDITEKIDPHNSRRIIRAYEVIKHTGKSILHWQKQNVSHFPSSMFKLIVLQPDRDSLYKNSNQRFLDMIELGALEEVKHLLKQNYNPTSGVMKSHGIPELAKYVSGEWTLNQAIEKSQQVVRNYAKRQTTWFKHQFNHPELNPLFITNPLEEFDTILNSIVNHEK